MHTNPAFRGQSAATNLAFARQRSFGMLAVSAAGAPMLSHVPFLLAGDGTFADLHLTRPNPITRACADSLPARLAVTGPEGYVSPDWYEAEGQVPTWNYVAVHLTGTLERLPDAALLPLLERLSDQFEERLAPKPVWKTAKLTPEPLARMLRQIVPFRLHIEAVDGTWKLGQNKPEAARRAAAGHMPPDLGALMLAPPQD